MARSNFWKSLFGLMVPERGVHKVREAAGGWSRRLRESQERGPVFNHKQEAETGCVDWKGGQGYEPSKPFPNEVPLPAGLHLSKPVKQLGKGR